ncbi:hypothetical protein V8F33_010664 [Rhypophila sp. PSN 637]
MTATTRYYLGLVWPYALNLVSFICLVSAIHFAIKVHYRPVLAWDVPLHLSYQKNRDRDTLRIRHSRTLARYNADLWNGTIQICGGLVAAVNLVAFRYRRPLWSTTKGRVTSGILASASSRPNRSLIRTIKDLSTSNANKMTLSSVMVWVSTVAFGAQAGLTLFGMHPLTWTMTSPIGPVSTAAISEELGFGVWVPAAAPWDLSAVMLRSAFEHVVSQKGPGALEITHRHLSHHLQESADGAGVRIGRTVYPFIRTHGVGVAPAPWERKGYRVPSSAGGRVLAYRPVVAGTNVTVQCRDSTEEWNWEHQVIESSFKSSSSSSKNGKAAVHRFDFAPKVDWDARGTNRAVSFVEGEGSRAFFVDTWQALKKTRSVSGDPAGGSGTENDDDQGKVDKDDEGGSESTTDDEPTIHQIFFFTKLGLHHLAPDPYPKVTVTLIDCQYGGHDLIRQVTMTSPIEPISIGPVLSTKEALTFDALYPAAVAIDEVLNHAGRGGAMVAGMTAGKMTSLEMWDMFLGRTLEWPELIENILTDTAQAYFSLVRQWREEALFLSWMKDKDLPEGDLTVTTNKQIGKGGGGIAWVLLLMVLGLLALGQLWGLTSFTRVAVDGVVGKSLPKQGLELKYGVLYVTKNKDD